MAILAGGGTLLLQGLNILTGTPQSGRWQWIIVGSLIIVLGFSIFWGNVRRRKSSAGSERRSRR